MTRFLCIASGKGGVGKTTIAINLATILHNFGRDVTLIDANLSSPSIGLYLGFTKFENTLHDVILHKSSIENATYLHPSGLKVIPANMLYYDSIDLTNFGNLYKKMYGKSEIVLLDSAPSLGYETVEAMKLADGVIVVTNPDENSIMHALKTIQVANKNSSVIGLIVNKLLNKKQLKYIKSRIDVPIIGEIPKDDNVEKSISKKHPLYYLYPNSRASLGLVKLAEMFL